MRQAEYFSVGIGSSSWNTGTRKYPRLEWTTNDTSRVFLIKATNDTSSVFLIKKLCNDQWYKKSFSLFNEHTTDKHNFWGSRERLLAADTSRIRILFTSTTSTTTTLSLLSKGNKCFPSTFDTNMKTSFYVINKYLLSVSTFENMQISVINRPNRKLGLLSHIYFWDVLLPAPRTNNPISRKVILEKYFNHLSDQTPIWSDLMVV